MFYMQALHYFLASACNIYQIIVFTDCIAYQSSAISFCKGPCPTMVHPISNLIDSFSYLKIKIMKDKEFSTENVNKIPHNISFGIRKEMSS